MFYLNPCVSLIFFVTFWFNKVFDQLWKLFSCVLFLIFAKSHPNRLILIICFRQVWKTIFIKCIFARKRNTCICRHFVLCVCDRRRRQCKSQHLEPVRRFSVQLNEITKLHVLSLLRLKSKAKRHLSNRRRTKSQQEIPVRLLLCPKYQLIIICWLKRAYDIQ